MVFLPLVSCELNSESNIFNIEFIKVSSKRVSGFLGFNKGRGIPANKKTPCAVIQNCGAVQHTCDVSSVSTHHRRIKRPAVKDKH